ncbi:MAG: epoxide hydrolase [Novosphingobium sp.]|nr:epoxide hydrolase [Novosphingobium sp.]MCP5388485.1 epoxide hydrolase [Novosphingobium sp.]
MSESIRPFSIAIAQDQLDDLNRRLDMVRWPDPEVVDGWSQGVPLAEAQKLVDYWRNHYDWRRCEAAINAYPQFKTTIDGVEIHFLHVRSPNPDALPLILTHGWPGSVIEFMKVIGPLSDPVAHGGNAADAFHLVIPSLPGYGFSGKPKETGWGVGRIARSWHQLMTRLGYDRYVAQGGDWGAAITTYMGADAPQGLAAIHVNLPLVLPEGPFDDASPVEQAALEALANYARWDGGYSDQQASRPQTLGYGLADSPVAQACWIYEKFWSWADCNGDPLNALGMDEMLDNIMLYWLNNTGTSSARLYWESFHGCFVATDVHIPMGCSIFPKDIYAAPRSWAEKCMHNLIYWNELDEGGHFAAFEKPELFTEELRKAFRSVR